MSRKFFFAFALVLMFISIASTGPVIAADKADPPTIKITDSGNPLTGDVEAIKAGRKLYKRWCLQCHGVKHDGVSPRWGKHGADLRKFWRGYKEFITLVMDGRPKKMMPPHKEYLKVQQVSEIGAYLETKAIKGAVWK